MQVDPERSRQAIAAVGKPLGMTVEQAALAIWNTANANMANAIHEMCTKKGHDIRSFTMVAGGGAGGAHVAGIARRLSIPQVIVPRVAALMSAYGMYNLDLGIEFARSWFLERNQVAPKDLQALVDDMRREAQEEFAKLGVSAADLSYAPSVEMRYAGQFTELEIELPSMTISEDVLDRLVGDFHDRHKQMFTYNLPWLGVEFLTFRVRVTAPRPELGPSRVSTDTVASAAVQGRRRVHFSGGVRDTLVFDWDKLSPGDSIPGPAVIVDRTTSVLVLPEFRCVVNPSHNLVLRPVGVGANQETAAVLEEIE
jgi:N-methylhydantoinase A